MSHLQLPYAYEDIISVENLLDAWREFLLGKRKKQDVQKFGSCFMDNILSFKTRDSDVRVLSKGLPLGNLTSQLFVNIYMNEFDQFVKHTLKAKYYIRYADDFVILHESKEYLEKLLQNISAFLEARLKLSLHPDKVFIKTIASGVDFLGWVHFPHHRVLRTSTKKRMFKKLMLDPSDSTLASYVGLLNHGNAYKLKWAAGLV